MRIVAFSDWRIQPLSDLEVALSVVSRPIDLIVYGGDDVGRFLAPSISSRLNSEARRIEWGARTELLPAAVQLHTVGFGLGADEHFEALTIVIGSASGRSIEEQLRYRTDAIYRYLKEKPTLQLQFRLIVPDLSAGPEALYANITSTAKLAFVPIRGCWLAVFYMARCSESPFSHLAAKACHGLIGVLGNDCPGKVRAAFHVRGASDIHSNPTFIKGFGVVGLESAPGGVVPFTEQAASEHLERCARRFPSGTPLVVVSHAPPKGTLDQSFRFGREHVGSCALKKFVLSHDVRLVLCGHAHACGGKAERLGRALVVNTANHDSEFSDGRVAVVDLDTRKDPFVEWVYPNQHSVRALQQCGPTRQARLNRAGIFLHSEVREIGPERVAEIAGVSAKLATKWHRHCDSMKLKRFGFFAPPDGFPNKVIYFDIETTLFGYAEHVWLIGAMASGEKRVWQAVATSTRDERAILSDFVDFVLKHPSLPLVCYSGNCFDHRYVERRLLRVLPKKVKVLAGRTRIDLCSYMRRYAVPPSPTYSLKDICAALNLRRRHSLHGGDIGAPYVTWLEDGIEPDWHVLGEYNEDDVLVLPKILARFRADARCEFQRPVSKEASARDGALRAIKASDASRKKVRRRA